MYKADLPLDRKESASIARKRIQEEQRKSRIFDAKTRLIGVDVTALEQQVQDKKAQEALQKQRDEAFATDAIRNDKIASHLENRHEQDVKELEKAMNDFRGLHQKAESRREFDIYDPDKLKKEVPVRIGDNDPRCGVASIQKFEGEDLSSKERSKFQQEQSKSWLAAQMMERNQAKINQDKADQLYNLKARELDQRSLELQMAEEECRKAIEKARKDYNLAQAREQSARNDLKSKQELDDNLTEIANNVYGDILTENPDVANSAFGAHRVVPDRWKGMSAAQKEEVLRVQELQRIENEKKRQEEQLEKEEWERQASAHNRAAMILEKQNERLQKEIKKKLDEENLKLSKHQNSFQEYIDKEVYINVPTNSYFSQFNTGTR